MNLSKVDKKMVENSRIRSYVVISQQRNNSDCFSRFFCDSEMICRSRHFSFFSLMKIIVTVTVAIL